MPIPVLVILGPTASGKSALAVALAQRLDGEIISADAFAVYQEMNIGTAKISTTEQAGIPHHLLSTVAITDRCDVSRWLADADAAVSDIHKRGKIPIVAGGTPLYVKALLEGLSAGAPRDEQVRSALDARYDNEGSAVLFAELQAIDPTYAAERHANDKRRIVRALEVYALTGRPYSSFHTTDGIRRSDIKPCLIGLQWSREIIYARIDARAAAMFEAGLVNEVRGLADRISPEAAQAVGYKEVLAYLRGEYDLARALELVQQKSRNLAKHQMTWYRNWKDIQWIAGDDPELVTKAEVLARRWMTESMLFG
jgi:tRNA dimethylallyltransferase